MLGLLRPPCALGRHAARPSQRSSNVASDDTGIPTRPTTYVSRQLPLESIAHWTFPRTRWALAGLAASQEWISTTATVFVENFTWTCDCTRALRHVYCQPDYDGSSRNLHPRTALSDAAVGQPAYLGRYLVAKNFTTSHVLVQGNLDILARSCVVAPRLERSHRHVGLCNVLLLRKPAPVRRDPPTPRVGALHVCIELFSSKRWRQVGRLADRHSARREFQEMGI